MERLLCVESCERIKGKDKGNLLLSVLVREITEGRAMLPKSGDHQTVPLSVLLKRELANEKIERPEISHGQASQSKKGEDFTFIKTECQRVLGDGVATYSVFAVYILSVCCFNLAVS